MKQNRKNGLSDNFYDGKTKYNGLYRCSMYNVTILRGVKQSMQILLQMLCSYLLKKEEKRPLTLLSVSISKY